MDLTIPSTDLTAILPQITLIGAASVLLLLSLSDRLRRAMPYLALLALAVVAVQVAGLWGQAPRSFTDMMVRDDFTGFADLIFIAGAILTILISVAYAETHGIDRGEYYALILFAVSGMSLMAASVDLFTFFLSLEVLSISLYVLIGFERGEPMSNEGALKYFLLGAFASGFILYGIALIYGATGTTHYQDLTTFVNHAVPGPKNLLLLAGLGLLLVGLGFKVSMAPFHGWTPDVYQGAPTPISAFMATGSKAAGFAVLIRVFASVFAELRVDWVPLLWGLTVLTMTIGNIVALVQTDLKRLLAYSSIAHAGYMLLAIVAGGAEGSSSILFYLLVYTLMNVAAFGVIAVLSAKGEASHTLDEIAGLGVRRPALAAVMAVAMFSLAGIPPTAGFMAKFYVFSAVVKADFLGLAVIGVLNSGVSLYYYLRVVVWMYMRESTRPVPSPADRRLSLNGLAALFISALALLQIGIMPSSLLQIAQRAVLMLR
ncbi:MAG: NADH-quinone oxidoreductase subunit N [Candidatus Latescibacteria bacterium]|nr:NADH-quinone oxidoreductase subunit N [Candidatus Latescibacterota bacterium]